MPMQRRSPATSSSPAQGFGQRIQSVLGQHSPRYNRFLDRLNQGSLMFSVPKGVGSDEYNYLFGIGLTPVGAGGTVTITVTAPRDLILRKLVLADGLSLPNVDWQVTALTVEGNACILGSGVGGQVFADNATNNPDLDLPVAAGTPISITVSNTGAAGIEITGGFVID